jgi:hypothetical protein
MRIVRLLLMGAMGMALVTASAQAGSPVTPAELAGEWSGSLAGTLPLVLHVQGDASGALTATMDSPAQGVNGLAGANAKLAGSSFSFEIPLLKGVFTGTVGADGKTISGTWTQAAMQGQSEPLEWKQTKTAAQAAAEMAKVKPSAIDGDWNGSLNAGGQTLRLVFHFHTVPGDAGETIRGLMDSLDQDATGIPCGKVTVDGRKVSVDVPAAKGTYEGTLSADGKTIIGTWSQGTPVELDLTRK